MLRFTRVCLVTALLLVSVVAPAGAQTPSVSPNSAYAGGVNAITVQGGGSAAAVVAVIERDSGMSVQALWMFVSSSWLYYLPALPTVGGLQYFPQTGAAYVVLAPRQTEMRVITQADNGGSFIFRVGERFGLELGPGYAWRIEVDDPTIIQSDPMILIYPPPSRSNWTARAVGTTMLRATGDLPCHTAQPPCLAPTRLFTVRITVFP